MKNVADLMRSRDRFRVRLSLFDGNAPSAAALAAVETHSRFAEAMRIVAEGGVAEYRGHRLTKLVVTDRGRFLISILALHFHYASRPGAPLSGLTISRMRRVCAEQKICSPGRAEAMMMLMRMFGYLASAPNEADRRLHRLVPTEQLIEWHRRRCAFTFEAVAKVLPEGAEALSALDLPEFLQRHVAALARTYLAGFYYVDHVPEMRLFQERNGGLVVLFSLMLAGDAGDSIPPERPLSISYSALARNFGVSRVHVRRMIQDAVDLGLLERAGADGEMIRILPRLAGAFRRWMALHIVRNAYCARKALDCVQEQSAVA